MKTIRLLKNSLSHLFRCETAASIMILCSLFFVYFSQFTFVGVMNPLRQLQQASSSYTSICITPSDSSIAADTLAFLNPAPWGRCATHSSLILTPPESVLKWLAGKALPLHAGMHWKLECHFLTSVRWKALNISPSWALLHWAHGPANKRSMGLPTPSLTMAVLASARCFGVFRINSIIMWMNMESTTSLLFHIAPFCRRLRSGCDCAGHEGSPCRKRCRHHRADCRLLPQLRYSSGGKQRADQGAGKNI